MVHAAPGDPSKRAHQELLEEEQTQLYHNDNVLPRCRRIVEIVQADIDECIFPNGSGVRRVLDAIMAETHGVLLYQRHRRRTWGLITEEVE